MTLPDVVTGQPHSTAHNDERHAINQLLGINPIGIPSPAPADGTLLAYSSATGTYVAVSPTGVAELAEAENASGTAISLNTQAYGGTVYTPLPGATIVVPQSNGRPVLMEWWGLVQQNVAGNGSMWCSLMENGTTVVSSIHPLPVKTGQTLDGSTYLTTFMGRARFAPFAASRTFQLNAMVYKAADGSAPTASILPLSNAPLTVRAVQG